MSTLMEKPIELQIEVGSSTQHEMDEDFAIRELEHCEWEDVFRILETTYSDMDIKVNSKDNIITIKFTGKSKPADEYEISLRFDDFLRNVPSIPIKSVTFV